MIKNIIFDVGNVLLGYRWKELIKDLGYGDACDAEFIEKHVFISELWLKMDRGECTIEELKKLFLKTYPDKKDIVEGFLEAADKMPVARPKVWEKVKALKDKGYNLYILSNYGKELFEMHSKHISILDRFDGILVSYMIKRMKPEKEIYEELLKRFSLNPSECVFLDDLAKNIEGAQNLGIKGIRITDEQMLLDLLDEWNTNGVNL